MISKINKAEKVKNKYHSFSVYREQSKDKDNW